jgi:hypothetical protein
VNIRVQLLQELLTHSRPVAEMVVELSRFPWDSKALVELTPEHVVSTLERYLTRELSADDVENWANAVESRDDIEYQKANAQSLRSAIHDLANPALTEPFNATTATKLLHRLRGLRLQR